MHSPIVTEPAVNKLIVLILTFRVVLVEMGLLDLKVPLDLQ